MKCSTQTISIDREESVLRVIVRDATVSAILCLMGTNGHGRVTPEFVNAMVRQRPTPLNRNGIRRGSFSSGDVYQHSSTLCTNGMFGLRNGETSEYTL